MLEFAFIFTLRLLHICEWTNKSLAEGWLPICPRMVEAGKSSSPAPLLKQVPLGPLLDCVQMAFEYLQRLRLHNLSGRPVPVLSCTRSKKNLS